MSDTFEMHAPGLTSPATRHAAVTPDDDEDLPFIARALYVLTDGDLVVRVQSVDITYPVFAGQVLSIRAVRILATGTTATCVAWV